MKLNIELLIENNKKIYEPIVVEEIVWQTERQGSPGQLSFKVIKDKIIKFTEGNAVRLKVNDKNIFYGFVFTKKFDKERIISVTAYDQLRYLKNKDTLVYSNLTADGLIKLLADKFRLQTGSMEKTKFKIASRVEDNTTLMDMIQNALGLTLDNTQQTFVLFDDFGKIALKNISNMIIGILIDEDTGEDFNYSSSIDSDVYNQIKLAYDNEKTGKRDIYMTKDSNNINKWGVLQYFDTLQKGENGKAKADALLGFYNKKVRTLSINNALGDTRVRAGSMIVVKLNFGEVKLNNLMLVEKCKHTFKNSEHLMDLTLKGSEIIA